MGDQQTVLVRVSGPDHPGITARLMAILSHSGTQIQNVEQISIRGHLNLSVVIAVPEGRDLLKELLLFGWDEELSVDFELVDESPAEPFMGHVITVLGAEVSAADLGAVAAVIAEHGGNINRIVRLSRDPVVSYEMLVQGGIIDEIRMGPDRRSRHTQCRRRDQRQGLGRRGKRLVVLDMDSTLIQNEVIDLIADEAGVESRWRRSPLRRWPASSTSSKRCERGCGSSKVSTRQPSSTPWIG